MVVQSLSDCVYKRSQLKGAIPETFLVYQSYSFGATAFALVIFQDALRTDWIAWKYGPVCGLVGFAAYYCFLYSLKFGQVSVNTVIFRLSFVLTALFAIIFLEEPISIRKGVGLLVAILAVASLADLPRRKKLRSDGLKEGTQAQRGKSLVFAVAAFTCLGTLSFFYKLAANDGVPAPLLIFIQFAFFSPLAMAYGALRRRFIWHPISAVHGLGAGVLLSLALMLLVSALMRGEAGVIVPINQMSFVLTAALAIPWFGESWSISKTTAVVLAVGVVLLLSG